MTFKYGNSEFEIIDGRVCLVLKPASHFGGLTIEQLLLVVEENFSEISHTHTLDEATTGVGGAIHTITESLDNNEYWDFAIPAGCHGVVTIGMIDDDAYQSFILFSRVGVGLTINTTLDLETQAVVSGTKIRWKNTSGLDGTTCHAMFLGIGVKSISDAVTA